MPSAPSFSFIFGILWQIIMAWWWLPLPFLLWKPAVYLWRWWRVERWMATIYKPIVLEIKIPKEIQKPIRAMETVMAGIHGVVYHPPDWWEEWVEGQIQTTISFEIASIEGEPHFYIRVHSAYRQAVEASIYSQYPEVEIKEVPDYTRSVPYNIPNEEWDLFAFDYCAMRPNPYPIKTYKEFETEMEKEEERIVDPVAQLLEAMAKIKPGEHLWIQMRATPLSEPDKNPTYGRFLKEGAAIRDKLARRKEPPKQKPLIEDIAHIFLTGEPPAPPVEEKEFIPVEMKLTPGEREVILAIEKKISKPAFRTAIRAIYLGKREVWFKPNFRLAFAFFNAFITANMNALWPWGDTLTKIHEGRFLPINLVKKRRHYLRCRKIFRTYLSRDNTLWPRVGADKGFFILNTEELASLYHFPSAAVAPSPTLSRIEAKKGEPPPELPIE